jgi:hypothetical protein
MDREDSPNDLRLPNVSMDHRVKPGGDERENPLPTGGKRESRAAAPTDEIATLR